jgi:4-carboxymuconolactone decarboxylase
MGPRIEPVAEPDDEQRGLLEKTLATPDGRPLNIFATLARHPRLLKRVNALGGLFMAHGSLPLRERELVILRAAFRSGSEYEWGQHVLIGRRAGLADEEIERVARTGADGWTEEEQALLDAVDELHARDELSDGTWERLARRWTPEQLLELVMMIGFYRMMAGYLRSVRVEPEPGLPSGPPAGGGS